MQYMGINEGFKLWLQQELDLRKWSRSELARRAGISVQSITAIYNSYRQPGPEVTNKIAAALKIPVSVVMIKANLMPADEKRSAVEEEISYKAGMLPEEKQKLVVDFINGLIMREQTEKNQDQ